MTAAPKNENNGPTPQAQGRPQSGKEITGRRGHDRGQPVSPLRLQRSRRRGWRTPPGAVYVGRGRPGTWATRSRGPERDRAAAVAEYRRWLSQPEQAELRRRPGPAGRPGPGVLVPGRGTVPCRRPARGGERSATVTDAELTASSKGAPPVWRARPSCRPDRGAARGRRGRGDRRRRRVRRRYLGRQRHR